MSSKKNAKNAASEAPRPMKVGSRVRCSDDGALGRITWANAISDKIAWDDGEAVTWRRDSLDGRPVQIIDDEPEAAPVQASAPEQAAEVTSAEQVQVQTPVPDPSIEQTPAEQTPTEPPAADQTPAAESGKGKQKPTRKPKKAKDSAEEKGREKEKKLSALDAAAKVLAQAGTPMNCQELVTAMAAQGYWSSPAGKTPHATLSAAILSETQTKGGAARFQKADRGTFSLRTTATQQ